MTAKIDVHPLKFSKTDLLRLMLPYKFALEEVNTKINILSQEF